MEIAGCGMVDPNVFEAVDRELGLDPGAQARYTGLTGLPSASAWTAWR
ncbi:MAG: hypothetical protein ACLSUW_01720 [Akkermansia sp.]